MDAEEIRQNVKLICDAALTYDTHEYKIFESAARNNGFMYTKHVERKFTNFLMYGEVTSDVVQHAKDLLNKDVVLLTEEDEGIFIA